MSDDTQEVSPPEVPFPAVIVGRIPVGNGKSRIEVMEVNGIDGLTVPTLLRMAANMKEESLTKGNT